MHTLIFHKPETDRRKLHKLQVQLYAVIINILHTMQ